MMIYLPPSLRERRRYILFEVMHEREITIDKRELLKAIWDSVYSLYGEVGASECRLWLIEYNKGVGILRCANGKVEEVRASLSCVHSVKGVQVGIRVKKISGTIRGARS